MELTPEIRAKRVAVCQDARAQALAETITVNWGYGALSLRDCAADEQSAAISVQSQLRDRVAGGVTDLKSVLDIVTPHCVVCANGALLLSKAKLFNAVPLERLLHNNELQVDALATFEALTDIFDQALLNLIECVFEGWTGMRWLEDRRVEWWSQQLHAEAGRVSNASQAVHVFVAVMDNIIANDGVLVIPESVVVPADDEGRGRKQQLGDSMRNDPHFDGRPCDVFAFKDGDLRVPAGIRLFGLAGKPFVTFNDADGKTHVYVHPDDTAKLKAANPTQLQESSCL